ncbi:MAG: protease pro-enzyme activation domain-containing protein, partial [Ktedonobacteraceae bacterium]
MQRNIVRNLLFVVTALLLIVASLIVVSVGVHAKLNARVALNGQSVPLIQKARLLHAADGGQQINLSIGLQVRNQPDLDNLLQAIYDPQSAQYHQYLTPEQFKQLFAPTAQQVQQVVSFLQSQGLTVNSVAPNNLLIDATGSVSQVHHAFNTQINTYQLGGRIFYANASAPAIPGSIASLVTSIGGLDNSVQYLPLYQRLLRQHASMGQHAHVAQQAGVHAGYGPKDLAGAYDIAALHSAKFLGDKQTVAVFELDGYAQSDIAQYLQSYNLGSPHIRNVLVDGFKGLAGQGALEAELDIEIVAAVAPHANQIVYEGPNTTKGLNDTYNRIVTDNKAQIATISWGLCEASTGAAELRTLDSIFKQAAAQGISFFAAAGDAGAYDCGDTNLAVDSPAGDPYITGVGGTNLQLKAGGGGYGSESVWSDPSATQRGPKGGGGGGGLSNIFKQATWQTGPGVKNAYSNGFREVPDVSADADPATGYAVYCTVTNAGCSASGWLTVGGTSAGAPLWAGSMALVNQYLQAQGKKNVGYANPLLYSIFNGHQQWPAFHDVTTGNNLYYLATGNYDMASGIGSPNVYNIARDALLLAGGGGGTPTPSPTATATPTDTPTPVPTSTNTPTPSPKPAPSVIKNGDFENGQAPWQQSSSKRYQLIDPSNVYAGQYSVYLCGYAGCNDSIWQSFTVPGSYTKITVSYWWYSDTHKTARQCLDNFYSELRSSTGSSVRMMQQSCNTNVTNNWVQQSFDVSNYLAAYNGKTVMLLFRGTNAAGRPQTSDFFVD